VQPQPAAGTAQPPANSSAAPSTAPTAPANPPAAGSTPSSTPAAEDNSKPNDSGNAAAGPEKGAAAPAKDSAAAKVTPNDSADNADEDSSPAPAKPAPKPKPTVPAVDPVSEAQKYLYGRGGVSQDCDRGMRLLKPAANQGNPRAMVEMGALYSAGQCQHPDRLAETVERDDAAGAAVGDQAEPVGVQ
jgi:TPR repeat protein